MAEKVFQILLIEDSSSDVLLAELALVGCGVRYQLEIIRDGDNAYRRVASIANEEAQVPDLLVLDLNLPIKSGIEVLGRFRANPSCARTPVIVTTTSNAPSDIANAARFGISHYFTKPSRLEEYLELGTLVKQTIGREAQSDAALG